MRPLIPLMLALLGPSVCSAHAASSTPTPSDIQRLQREAKASFSQYRCTDQYEVKRVASKSVRTPDDLFNVYDQFLTKGHQQKTMKKGSVSTSLHDPNGVTMGYQTKQGKYVFLYATLSQSGYTEYTCRAKGERLQITTA